MKEALFYQKEPEMRVKCTLCPRYCELNPDQRGFCYVRQNIDGKLYSLAYGKPYAVNVDPIEKKPLFHFLPGSRILSIGTAGCNMACKFCQNWDLSKARLDQDRAIDLPPTRVVQMARHYETQSIAYTYNEPTIFAEYAMETAKLGREYHLRNVMVTNGYITPEAIDAVYQNMDAANVDLKGFSEQFYQQLALSHLQPVLDTLVALNKMGVWIEITNLIIPGYNDSITKITQLCEWVLKELGAFVPVHFTAFHPSYKMLDVPPTTPTTLLNARNRALEIGIKYVYVGNVSNREASSTYCHQCKTLLIRRDWYTTENIALSGDRCSNCGSKIPGVFA